MSWWADSDRPHAWHESRGRTGTNFLLWPLPPSCPSCRRWFMDLAARCYTDMSLVSHQVTHRHYPPPPPPPPLPAPNNYDYTRVSKVMNDETVTSDPIGLWLKISFEKATQEFIIWLSTLPDKHYYLQIQEDTLKFFFKLSNNNNCRLGVSGVWLKCWHVEINDYNGCTCQHLSNDMLLLKLLHTFLWMQDTCAAYTFIWICG